MRVTKKFIKRDKNSIDAEAIVDNVLLFILNNRNPFFDKMELIFSDEDRIQTAAEERRAKIHINCYTKDFEEKDLRAVKIHILRLILSTYAMTEQEDELLREVQVNRELMKMGFSDDLFYYLYKNITATKAKNYEDFVKLSVAWMSYHKHDKFYEDFLKKTIDKLHNRKEYQSRFKKDNYLKRIEKAR